ncbi:MAG TPA: MauE/DoxX family redox-associated membrane protein [Thermoanaerobaculia bacterium]|nr:MauE/DoxX family redox-associated membrane protein [Thermoanaerobaculia bacterium]
MESTQSPTVPTPRSPRPLLWWVGTFGGAFLGAVLLFAVWAKAIDPPSFVDQIRTEGLDFLLPARAVALIALALEAGLGLLLLLGVRRKWVLIPATLLVAFFLSLTGRAWWLAEHGQRNAAESCGCFGNLVQRTPAQAFWQDLALLVPALLLAWVGRERRPPLFPPKRTAVAAIGTLAVLFLAWKAPELPLDNLATRLRPGTEVSKTCVGEGAQRVCLNGMIPELQQGKHLVVMAKLDDPAFTKAVDALNAYASNPGPALWVLTSSTADQQRAFFWQWGPRFQIREAPPELLRPLYRRLPRSFAVKDGRVTATFQGLPPAVQAPASSKPTP